MQLQLKTWQFVDDYLKTKTGIIIPIGSTEQHGPTGLIGTDALTAEMIARGAGEKVGALVAPTISVGMAQHHLDFAGSITLKPTTLIAVVRDTPSVPTAAVAAVPVRATVTPAAAYSQTPMSYVAPRAVPTISVVTPLPLRSAPLSISAAPALVRQSSPVVASGSSIWSAKVRLAWLLVPKEIVVVLALLLPVKLGLPP